MPTAEVSESALPQAHHPHPAHSCSSPHPPGVCTPPTPDSGEGVGLPGSGGCGLCRRVTDLRGAGPLPEGSGQAQAGARLVLQARSPQASSGHRLRQTGSRPSCAPGPAGTTPAVPGWPSRRSPSSRAGDPPRSRRLHGHPAEPAVILLLWPHEGQVTGAPWLPTHTGLLQDGGRLPGWGPGEMGGAAPTWQSPSLSPPRPLGGAGLSLSRVKGQGEGSRTCTRAPGGPVRPQRTLEGRVHQVCAWAGAVCASHGLRRVCRRSTGLSVRSALGHHSLRTRMFPHQPEPCAQSAPGGTIHPSLGEAASVNQRGSVHGCGEHRPPRAAPGLTRCPLPCSPPLLLLPVDGTANSMATERGGGSLAARRALGGPSPRAPVFRTPWPANTWLRGFQGAGLNPPTQRGVHSGLSSPGT